MCHMKAVHYAARSAGPMKAKRGPVEPVEREKRVERPYRTFT